MDGGVVVVVVVVVVMTEIEHILKRSGRKGVVRSGGKSSGFVGIALHKPRAAERTKLIHRVREREKEREKPAIDVMECKGEHVVVQFRGWYNTTSKPSQVSRQGG